METLDGYEGSRFHTRGTGVTYVIKVTIGDLRSGVGEKVGYRYTPLKERDFY